MLKRVANRVVGGALLMALFLLVGTPSAPMAGMMPSSGDAMATTFDDRGSGPDAVIIKILKWIWKKLKKKGVKEVVAAEALEELIRRINQTPPGTCENPDPHFGCRDWSLPGVL